MKLTQTEQRIVELYRRGMKPREIAESLGVSVNTVYKALSKARRILGELEPPREDKQSDLHIGAPRLQLAVLATVNTTLTLTNGNGAAQRESPCPQMGEILEAIRRLEAEIAELKRMLRQQPAQAQAVSERIKPPDYIGANLWVDILRRR